MFAFKYLPVMEMAFYGMVTGAEWARAGHPDRVASMLKEGVYTALRRQDPNTRADVKVLVGADPRHPSAAKVHYSGQVTSGGSLRDMEGLTRGVLRSVGYPNDVRIIHDIISQSHTLRANGGFGDSRILYGYSAYNPIAPASGLSLPHYLAMALCRKLDKGEAPDWVLPDGKVQVAGTASFIDSIDVCVQHHPGIGVEEVRREIEGHYILPLLDRCKSVGIDTSGTLININGAGAFRFGFPSADAAIGNKDANIIWGGNCPAVDLEYFGRDPRKPDKLITVALRKTANKIRRKYGVDVALCAPALLGRQKARVYAATSGYVPDVSRELLELSSMDVDGLLSYTGLDAISCEDLERAARWCIYEPDFPWERDGLKTFGQ